ncbi:replication restart DNA helicase PriA [Leptolyngbya sp. 'hensonii']|uniref:replication restart DNA helicase PriA n=1 Tax=Leptolyngbya sp. 'hensonii' TaxID=1922337 RepID=UPI00094FE8AC|nr:replication restart DNA helicase PriA [Leptolyngbya sp. 'hensonii']OLP19490.1 replication restart DNA helicase PriA [Leptolyngbya sp. 'hensonii']
MKTVETVRCSNCGSLAERHYLSSSNVVRTQCEVCDYLMITCSLTGRVLESYAPGTGMLKLRQLYPVALTCEARS